jgi:hypothetical protein
MAYDPARDAMNRALFEALLWENAPRISSPAWAERDAGLAVVMAAYDKAVRTRRRRPQLLDVGDMAEEARQFAQARYGDEPHVTAARRRDLAEAIGPGPVPPRRTRRNPPVLSERK